MADGDKQYVNLPDGTVGEFDRGMSDEEVQRAIQSQFPSRPGAEQTGAGAAGSAAAFGRRMGEATRGAAGKAYDWLTEKQQPGQPEKVRSPMGQLREGWSKAEPYYPAGYISKGLTAAGEAVGGFENRMQTGDQAAIARGQGEPGTLARIGRGIRTETMGGIADMLRGAGALTTPRATAELGGAMVAPELAIPAFVAQGGKASIDAWHKGQKEGWTPGNIQNLLASAGGTALAAGGVGEMVRGVKGGIKPPLTGEMPKVEQRGGGLGTLPEIPKMGTHEIANAMEREFARPPELSAETQMNALAVKKFGKLYDNLGPEEKVVVARDIRPEGAERRVVRGQGPTVERRAEEMPLPTKAPGAPTGAPQAAPWEPANRMGIRWATNWGGPDISIPNSMTDPAAVDRYVAEKQQLQRTGMAARGIPTTREQIASPAQPVERGGPPAAPPPTTLPSTREGTATRAVPSASLDEILRQATGQQRLEPGVPLREQPKKVPGAEGTASAEQDPLKLRYPDPAVRRFVRANGEAVVEATRDDPKALQAIHDLKNWEVRQAAINAGIDLGQQHVGSRQGLGPEQVSRQALLDQMIREKGVKPADIPGLARPKPMRFGNEEDFARAAETGRIHRGVKSDVEPAKGLPRNAITYGEAEGYPPADIAHFYVKRRGGGDLGRKIGWEDYQRDREAIEQMRTVPAGQVKVGDTFVDEHGEPRRVVDIEDGKIHTADGTARTYKGEIHMQGEINNPTAQLARGGKFIPGPEAKTQREPRGSTVPMWTKPLRFAEKPDVETLAGALAERTKTAGLAPVSAAEAPELAMKRAMRLGESEIDYQRKQVNSGEAWYVEDMKKYDNALRAYHPDLAKNDSRLTLAKAIQAGLSLGSNTVSAITKNLDAIDAWRKTGKIPLMNPETGRAWPNGQFNAYLPGFRTLQKLIDEKREAGAAKWLMEMHPVSELRQYRPGVSGKAADMEYGALALGDKTGPFFLNMMGIDHLTTDMWWARTWNRWMATPFGKAVKNGKSIEALIEAPRNASERAVMEQFAAALGKLKGLEMRQVQAILWNYEQSLYKLHGIESEQPSYGAAAKTLVEERTRSRNAGRGGQTKGPRKNAVP